MSESKTDGILSSGKTWKIGESRKSAIPEGVPGKHFIVAIQADFGLGVRDCMFVEVTPEEEAEAFLHAKVFAEHLTAELGAPGSYRITQNGPSMANRPNYHLHVICLALNAEQIKNDFKMEPRRLIDPDSFLVPIVP